MCNANIYLYVKLILNLALKLPYDFMRKWLFLQKQGFVENTYFDGFYSVE